MVSTSTRRFPSTAIDAAVWAAAGETQAQPRGGTGTANMIRAARSPPHSHSKHHAQRALVIPCRPHPTNRQIPNVALLVANFAGAANQTSQCDSIFIPRRCQWATSQKSRYYDLPNSPLSHGT
jgi:hypothetical protein